MYTNKRIFIHIHTGTNALVPLSAFCGSTVLAISMMGGMFAVTPAYEADLFGAKYVGAIHGRMLLAVSAAALTGPALLIYLRSLAEKSAINSMLATVDPTAFSNIFGAPISHSQQLLEAKTLSISKLITLAPPGTLDPSPYLYNDSTYVLAGLMAVAAGANALVVGPALRGTKSIEVKDINSGKEGEIKIGEIVGETGGDKERVFHRKRFTVTT